MSRINESTTKRIGYSTTKRGPFNQQKGKGGTNTYRGGAEFDLEEIAKRIYGEIGIPQDLVVGPVTAQDKEAENKTTDQQASIITPEESKNPAIMASMATVVNPFGNTEVNRDDSNLLASATFDGLSESESKKVNENKIRKELSQAELDENFYITLNETETIFMYHSPSVKYFINKNDNDENHSKKRDDAFNNYQIKRKNPESFLQHGTQTINSYRMNQVVSTTSVKDDEFNQSVNSKVGCLSWEIHDSKAAARNTKFDDAKLAQKMMDKRVNAQLKDRIKNSSFTQTLEESLSMQRSQNITDSFIDSISIQSSRRPKPKLSVSVMESTTNIDKSKRMDNSSPTSSKNIGESVTSGNRQVVPATKVKKALEEVLPNSLQVPLRYVERLLSQNKFHFRQIAYKNYPINKEEFNSKINNIEEQFGKDENDLENEQDRRMKEEIALVSNEDNKPTMKHLFTFSGKGILKGEKYNVNCLDWNPFNPDLLAAGYGDSVIDSKKEGLLCFWTLKNPLHPERVIHTPRGISSCNFSTKNPYYIVVADYAGEIMIYDLRNNNNKPIADSTDSKDKHNDVVWECRFIQKPNAPDSEMIISISSDGKVKEWFLKKGLEVSDLMIMKKTQSLPDKSLNPFTKYENKGAKEGLIFREANGLSFDFPNNDTTVYYVALEECTLHRCRISYKDQYTDSYYGHQGPVYKVRCNPYDPNYFISCSYDWTIKIWNSKHSYPMINCHSETTQSQVNDVEWSPFTSTIFGLVADDGRIEIWDLAKHTVDPLITEMPTNYISRKCFKFSKSSQVVATGNNDFDIDVFRLYNLEHVQVSDDDQKLRLQTAINQNSELAHKTI